MSDWFFDNLGWVLLALFLLVIFALGFMFAAGYEARKEFMLECLQDHKKYECTVMYESSQPQVVPMPIVVPVGVGR